MTDYYPLIARAVEELGTSTGEARQALYERARNAVAQLRSNPALFEPDIARECLALEEAIRKVEAETTGEGGPAVFPTAREQLLSGRSSRKRKAVKESHDVVRDGPDLGAPTAKATQTACRSHQPYERDARQYPPAKEYLDPHDYSGDYAARQERNLEPAYEPDDEQPVVAPASRHTPRNAAQEEEYGRKGRGLAILPVVLIIFAGVVAAIYWQRPAITEFYRHFGSRPQSPTGQETSLVRPKLSGRVRLEQDRGQAPAPAAVGDQTAPAVAQRVVLYEEDPSDPHGKRYVGSAIWRTEMISAGSEIAPEVAVRADAEIPERGMTVSWSLRRNTDKALPASYTIETMFKLSADFPGGGIADVPGILTKQAEQARGTELAGRAIKVTEGFFLIGLSAGDTDVQRNEQLLKDRPWFDIPIVYTNGGRALLAMEKGPPSARAFAEAFAVWKKEITPGTE